MNVSLCKVQLMNEREACAQRQFPRHFYKRSESACGWQLHLSLPFINQESLLC